MPRLGAASSPPCGSSQLGQTEDERWHSRKGMGRVEGGDESGQFRIARITLGSSEVARAGPRFEPGEMDAHACQT